jgi:hypothetical protein
MFNELLAVAMYLSACQSATTTMLLLFDSEDAFQRRTLR